MEMYQVFVFAGILLTRLVNQGVSSQSIQPQAFFTEDAEVPENTPVHARDYTGVYYGSNTVNTTVLMTYNTIAYDWYTTDGYTKQYSMGYEGFVYGFHFIAIYSEPIRISIWRWNEIYIPWGQTAYMNETMYNGKYTLVAMTETIYPIEGENYFHLDKGVWVTPNDFLGITFLQWNPIPYDLDPICNNIFNNILQTCERSNCVSETPGWDFNDWYGYSDYHEYYTNNTYWFSDIDPNCKMFALQALLMEDHLSEFSHCTMIQLTNDSRTYQLKSHDDYGQSDYLNLFDFCWVVRAADADSRIYVEVVGFDVEDSANCMYDYLSVEYDNGLSSRHCGRQSGNPNFNITERPMAILNFHTDSSIRDEGFFFKLRSVSLSVYRDYMDQGRPNNYVWPWHPDYILQSTAPPPGAEESLDEGDLELAVKIGVGIGASILILFLLGLIIGCCYVCCCQNKTKRQAKVGPHGATPVDGHMKNGGGHSSSSSKNYPRQGGYNTVRPRQQAGVYMIPQPQGPVTPHTLPPLSTTYPSMPHRAPPPPYPTQRYGPQPPPYQAEVTTNPIPRQPAAHSPPQHSFSTVAFALRQPKPLKPIQDPFGGTVRPEMRTEAEMMALGRARLNWGVVVIPGPATYVEPQQWRQGVRGQAPPPPPPPCQPPPQGERFAENDITYAID